MLLRCVLLTLLLAPGQLPRAEDGWAAIQIVNGHVAIPSSLAGIPGLAVLDTGSQVNGISGHFLRSNKLDLKAGETWRIQGIHRVENRRTYLNVDATLFGAEVRFKRLVEIGFGHAQLLLGASFLERYTVQIDYPGKRMRLLPRDAIDWRQQRNIKSKRDPDTGEPIVQVTLDDGKRLWLQLDTGMGGGLLVDHRVAMARKWPQRFTPTTEMSQGVNSLGTIETLVLPNLTVGPYQLGNVRAAYPSAGADSPMFRKRAGTGSHLKRYRGKAAGILGYDVLKHFIVTIDYRKGFTHLEIP